MGRTLAVSLAITLSGAAPAAGAGVADTIALSDPPSHLFEVTALLEARLAPRVPH